MKSKIEMKQTDKYAIVTGASQGLGKAFANELAKEGYNIILTSLADQNLNETAQYLRETYGVLAHAFESDLSEKDNIIEFCSWVNKNFEVEILINNAGVGGTKRFDEVSLEYINVIMQLNMIAPSILTQQLLENLKRNKQAYILNVSSMAAFTPIGFKTVYPASKAFLHSFSLGLSEELKYSNISVSVVNPGAMKTNDEVTKRIEQQGFFGRFTLLSPNKVARNCINKMFRKNKLIIVNPYSYFLMKLLPSRTSTKILTNTIRRELNIV